MDREAVRHHCLQLTGAYEDFPFGADVAVFKVLGKMFALLPIEPMNLSISLKADPQEAIMLRDMYSSITAGYHLNKTHWNTIHINGDVPEPRIVEMIEDSYQLVVQKLPRREQQKLNQKKS